MQNIFCFSYFVNVYLEPKKKLKLNKYCFYFKIRVYHLTIVLTEDRANMADMGGGGVAFKLKLIIVNHGS